ncbi:MAG: bifunctional aconitate hydratase 2/2-methylisocitrate dehydratase [Desulfobulbus propionicus]|nr:MAG: bifunctional aconitate hydratase 2/2-methylisocitrate dehydratase [Desulfobulbus propionicus]
MLTSYEKHISRRAELGLPPLPLNAEQVAALTEVLVKANDQARKGAALLADQVEPGVSPAAKVKADWLEKVASGKVQSPVVSAEQAFTMLARMEGGYNVTALMRLLVQEKTGARAAACLKKITKVYDAFSEVASLARDNQHAREVLLSWAEAEWFTTRSPLPEELKLVVYKVSGEINTDDFSPGNQAQSRADIPLHATFFGHTRFPDGIERLTAFRASGRQVCFAGDVVGTGSSRKSAINSMAWYIGEDIPAIPNKRRGGVILGGTIAPIFYATARDAGLLPIEGEVDRVETGDEVVLHCKRWSLRTMNGENISLKPAPPTILDEYRAGGRLNLIIGRNLTRAACSALGMPEPSFFAKPGQPQPEKGQAFTQAQKILGRACGVKGVLPGMVCEPVMTTVGSQDTTGPMTVQEIAELACLRFKAGLVMQSFCHTAAYPKASDPGRWQTMTDTMQACGGIVLKPGDGVIHSWLNKMLVPDTVGTGGDSHTRFPIGISFPAGSGLVAFAAALGFMPLEVPESVLVRFVGRRRAGITLRDMVNAIPWFAAKQGMLTIDKKGKKNIFAGTILEIEGVDTLSVDEAFELADASAERSAAACCLSLSREAVVSKVKENITILQALVAEGYEDADTLRARIDALQQWLETPTLLSRDEHAAFAHVLEIDLAEIDQPLLACPNDPDDVRPLEEVAGTKIDETFIGSCMTHLKHHRVATRLLFGEPYAKSRTWVAPATRIDRDTLQEEGGLSVYAQVGARVEVPGCSLCMGNQARVQPGATVVSTSTRNFDNRLGDGAQVYLGSTEVTAISGQLGRLPTVSEYFGFLERKGCLEQQPEDKVNCQRAS